MSTPRSKAPSLDSLLAKIRASTAKDRNMLQALANASGTAVAAVSSPPAPPARKPLMLTFVSYQQGDLLGKVAALVTLTPIFAHVALASWIVARRELHAACLLLGSVVNTALCIAIKSQLQQPRPVGATLSDYGMPSNHAQTTVFLVGYCVVFLWHGCSIRHAAFWKPALTLAAAALAFAVGASRIYLGEHSVAQVLVGSLVGAATALAWYACFCSVLRPLLLPLLEQPPLRYFYVRDNSHTSDVMRREYEAHRAGLQIKAR
jgi:dolichyldiphosphatase